MTREARPRERSGFRVPLGLDESEKLTSPDAAVKGVVYRCPGCDARLVLRKGTKMRPHFAHKATTSCSGESALHAAAKLLVAQTIAAGLFPEFELSCPDCRGSFVVPFPKNRTLLPSVEHRLDNGRVLDVALTAGGEIALAVEVFKTSSVSEEKAAELSMPWIEVEASEILLNPVRWRAKQHSLKVTRCQVCRRAEAILCEELEHALARFRLDFDRDRYRVRPVICWKCDNVIPVFKWGDDMWSTTDEPPSPRPRSLRWVFTQTAGTHYWANHCPSCGTVQGTSTSGERSRSSTTTAFIGPASNLARLGERHSALWWGGCVM